MVGSTLVGWTLSAVTSAPRRLGQVVTIPILWGHISGCWGQSLGVESDQGQSKVNIMSLPGCCCLGSSSSVPTCGLGREQGSGELLGRWPLPSLGSHTLAAHPLPAGLWWSGSRVPSARGVLLPGL